MAPEWCTSGERFSSRDTNSIAQVQNELRHIVQFILYFYGYVIKTHPA